MMNLFSMLSPWSKRSAAIGSILLVAAMFVACGDDDSDFATRPSGGSSLSSSSAKSSGSVYRSGPCKVETDENCFKDDRDGQTYKTVKIGNQVWMAENLNFEMDSCFCYNDSVEYCTKYGRFYSWWTAIEVCPNGWHLPTKMEWDTLFNAVGGDLVAGTKLKSTSGWYDNGNGTDAFGFSALSAGYRYYHGYYNYEGDYAYFWSSTELSSGSDYAYFMSLLYDNDGANLVTNRKVDGFSVRCVKDSDDGSSSSVKNESSSSVTLSSSSSDINIIEESSSSADLSNSSSSDSDGSSSSTGEAGWSWDVPKEERLNSEITYGSMTDSRDKKVYKTVKIGEQTWMAENLDYDDSTKTPSLLERSWCYNNDSANCAVAGRLYTWAAAIDSAKLYNDKSIDCGYRKACALPDTVYGICPPGWHLPTRTEWKTLWTEVGERSNAGKILKSQTGWYNNGNGTDSVGFSALPAGGWDAGNGEFYAGGHLACFWSATEDDVHASTAAYLMDLSYEDEYANLNGFQNNYGFSVRCIKDDP